MGNVDESKITKELYQFVTIRIGDQNFGILVEHVVDILFSQKINPIPLARKEILGSLNLRGRIVTSIDIRMLLQIDKAFDANNNMCIVIEYGNELFSLVVDEVGEVITVNFSDLTNNPDNLSNLWQEISLGIFLMKEELIVILDINKVMEMLVGQ
jgi:purine-binding chemotaxis protein CheW